MKPQVIAVQSFEAFYDIISFSSRPTLKTMKKSSEAINIVNLDQFGIVAGIIDEMELVEEVNTKVGIRIKETVSPGQVMKAMILNGLGFLSAPIYLFDTFLWEKQQNI